MYEGKCVRLRGLRREDTKTCAAWLNDLETMRLAGGGAQRPLADDECWTWLDNSSQNRFGVETLDGRLIGMCVVKGCNEQSRHCSVGWLIGEKDAREKGNGTDMIRVLLKYTFEERGMARVSLDVFDYNDGAVRLYEKMGFVHEGHLRQHEYTMGRYWDVHVFSMLKREYDALYGGDA